MIKVIHRINTIKELKKIPAEYGVEIDVRTWNDKLILNHEPKCKGELLDNYLNKYKHKFLIIDVKEEGIENDIINLCKKYNIEDYFLLGVTFPFMLKLANNGFRKMACRFSEYESVPIKLVNKIDWVWIDTFTILPYVDSIIKDCFNTVLVSPDRWDRPEDIENYKKKIKTDMVMTELKYVEQW